MANGPVPYPAYTYLVTLTGPRDFEKPVGGFSSVSGLTGAHQVGDVTLKRGVVSTSDLWNWLNQVRTNRNQALRTVVINLRNQVGNPVQTWKLTNTVPKTYSGPTLSGPSGGNIAIEELELSSETIMLVPPNPPGHRHK